MAKLNWKRHDDTESIEYDNFLDIFIKETEIYDESSLKSNFSSKDDNWFNALFCGDNLRVMHFLSKRFSNKINLIYIDPPFFSKSNYNLKVQLGSRNQTIDKLAYDDRWHGGLDSYIDYMHNRLSLMEKLLAKDGSIYLHIDWHVSHYIKLVMDEIFGENNFRNEIIWAYPAASAKTRKFFIRSYDSILFYTKSDDYIFNDDPAIYMEYSDRVKDALKRDEKGLFYYRGGSHDRKKLSRKVYIKNPSGTFPRDVWNDIPYIRANTLEYQGFSTQKPERLFKRILLASTNKNDIVADFFCGSGTTVAAAEKLGRRWIGCDISFQSIHLSRKRLLNLQNSRDLHNWKKNYALATKPFKIFIDIAFDPSQNLKKSFIKPELLTNFSSTYSELKPTTQIKVTQQEDSVSVKLESYNYPYKQFLVEKLKNNLIKLNDWIDFWSVDFQYDNTSFKNMWSSFKSPQKRTISLISKPYRYQQEGKYTIGVKVVDILGLETLHTEGIEI